MFGSYIIAQVYTLYTIIICQQNNCSMQNTCLQLERNTTILEWRCALTKLHSISNFWSRGTVIAVCCRRLGVADSDSSCTLRYSGSFKLSLARSWTDLVCVAEKRNVCRCFGNWEMMAFNSFLNPTSRMRSGSSRTKTCCSWPEKTQSSQQCNNSTDVLNI